MVLVENPPNRRKDFREGSGNYLRSMNQKRLLNMGSGAAQGY